MKTVCACVFLIAVVSARHKLSTQLFEKLTNDSHYDANEAPIDQLIVVSTSAFVYLITSIDSARGEYEIELFLQYSWIDNRLAFNDTYKYPGYKNITRITGETNYQEKVWYPNIYIVNERESQLHTLLKDNVYMTITREGQVSYSYRVRLTLSCTMELMKFPYDRQKCGLEMESWSYSDAELKLMWAETNPMVFSESINLVDFSLEGDPVLEETTKGYDQGRSLAHFANMYGAKYNGANYSGLRMTFEVKRQPGHYVLDYYIPSVLLVMVSWVSFWLDPNAAPARVTLGTTTLLAFITLKRNLDTSLPKVSYITAMGWWVFACMAFIFMSLVEFAFVHSIHLRSEGVEIKKPTAKYIIKAGLSPSPSRAVSRRPSLCSSNRSRSMNDLQMLKYLKNLPSNPELTVHSVSALDIANNRLSVDSLNTYMSENFTMMTTTKESSTDDIDNGSIVEIPVPDINKVQSKPKVRRRLSKLKFFKIPFKRKPKNVKPYTEPLEWQPRKVARWIDQKSRIVFPVLFLFFNVLYWCFLFVF